MENIVVAAYTLGCKVNHCDTENILKHIVGAGGSTVNFTDQANVYIINTCTVTHASDKKSMQVIRRAKRQNPHAMVVVCGCMAQKPDITPSTLGVDFVFDSRKPEDLLKFLQLETVVVPIKVSHRTRAFVKIQDGCDRFCAYCIVPYMRGLPKSREAEDIIQEVKDLVNTGVNEVVLTGIQVAAYGEDLKNTSLAKLIGDINFVPRLRLSSLEPCAINSAFIAMIKNAPYLCQHFHISLQSGCDATLQRMNRRYTTQEYAHIVEQLRSILPNVAITTDIIVGFPGETEEEFDQTLAFVQEINFARIHVFEYSKREGTPAATFENQVPEITKTNRSKILRDLATNQALAFYQGQVGQNMAVLFETSHNSTFLGHTSNYCPVEINHKNNLSNTIQNVAITGYNHNGLTGTIMEDNYDR